MPFVIGVMGIDGPSADGKQKQFRKAQAAAADLPEFAGNVTAVLTENCWDMEWVKISAKPKDTLTPNEQKIMETATSNAGFHYMGSAYTYSMIGKAMAEAMIKLEKK
jgi:alpha-galactosidase